MRRDARVNREKLLLAGRRLMQDEGGDVPVERICDLAGVTRGTFYRNFADRAALYGAVLERELAALGDALAAPDCDPLAFLRLLAAMMMVYDKYLAALPDMADYQADGASRAKIVAVLVPALHRAQAAGAIAQGVTGDDIMLACRMLACDWRLDRVASREEALDRRLDLVLRGLAPRG